MDNSDAFRERFVLFGDILAACFPGVRARFHPILELGLPVFGSGGEGVCAVVDSQKFVPQVLVLFQSLPIAPYARFLHLVPISAARHGKDGGYSCQLVFFFLAQGDTGRGKKKEAVSDYFHFYDVLVAVIFVFLNFHLDWPSSFFLFFFFFVCPQKRVA